MHVTVIANRAAAMRWPLAARWRKREPSDSARAESLRRAGAPVILDARGKQRDPAMEEKPQDPAGHDRDGGGAHLRPEEEVGLIAARAR